MVHEVQRQVVVDGAQVPVAEQGGDEGSDSVLVLLDRVHG
jgi:hypothetical protein